MHLFIQMKCPEKNGREKLSADIIYTTDHVGVPLNGQDRENDCMSFDEYYN